MSVEVARSERLKAPVSVSAPSCNTIVRSNIIPNQRINTSSREIASVFHCATESSRAGLILEIAMLAEGGDGYKTLRGVSRFCGSFPRVKTLEMLRDVLYGGQHSCIPEVLDLLCQIKTFVKGTPPVILEQFGPVLISDIRETERSIIKHTLIGTSVFLRIRCRSRYSRADSPLQEILPSILLIAGAVATIGSGGHASRMMRILAQSPVALRGDRRGELHTLCEMARSRSGQKTVDEIASINKRSTVAAGQAKLSLQILMNGPARSSASE